MIMTKEQFVNRHCMSGHRDVM